jgi:glutathione S-transferase
MAGNSATPPNRMGIFNAIGKHRLYTALYGMRVFRGIRARALSDEAVVEAAVPQALTSIGALETLLGDGAFLAGASPSLADLHLIPIYDYVRQTPEGERLFAGAPNLGRWWAGIAERPSVTKTTPRLE